MGGGGIAGRPYAYEDTGRGGGSSGSGSSVGAWISFALQSVMQAAPHLLLTRSVYHAIMAAALVVKVRGE